MIHIAPLGALIRRDHKIIILTGKHRSVRGNPIDPNPKIVYTIHRHSQNAPVGEQRIPLMRTTEKEALDIALLAAVHRVEFTAIAICPVLLRDGPHDEFWHTVSAYVL